MTFDRPFFSSGKGALSKLRFGGQRINVGFFFDVKRLSKYMDDSERALLAKFGAAVRTIARRSMKRVSDPTDYSAPGKPPHAHTGFMKESLAFQYVPEIHGVIIGSMKGHRVADLHEFGGTYIPRVRNARASWDFRIGGYGPIALNPQTGKGIVIKLRTESQVSRAITMAAKASDESYRKGLAKAGGKRRYPARPYLSPAFETAKRDVLPRLFEQVYNRGQY